MGPLFDKDGVEQDGINSSDYNKIYNYSRPENLQAPKQGVFLGNKLNISSNDIYMLYNLMVLALNYWGK